MNENEVPEIKEEATEPLDSYYDGDLLTFWFFSVVAFFCRVLTLDLAAPIVVCYRLRWRAEHIHLSGRRMVFTGKIGDLFAKNAIWVLISVVTIGIFIPFKILRMAKWETNHLHFVGVSPKDYEANPSELRCKWYAYFAMKILCSLLDVLTLGIAHFWIFVRKERTIARHTLIDGHELAFRGTIAGYFKKRMLWWVFTVLTLGIYTVLLKGKILRWKISNTVLLSPQTLPYGEEVASSQPVHPVNRRAYFNFFLLFPTALFFLGAWSAKVLCLHGAENLIRLVPFAIWLGGAVLLVFDLLTGVRAHKFAISVKSTKPLSVTLLVVDGLFCAICVAVLVVLVLMMC